MIQMNIPMPSDELGEPRSFFMGYEQTLTPSLAHKKAMTISQIEAVLIRYTRPITAHIYDVSRVRPVRVATYHYNPADNSIHKQYLCDWIPLEHKAKTVLSLCV